MDSERPRPERDQTDESLRTERKNTDQALTETRQHIEETADNLLEHGKLALEPRPFDARDLISEAVEAFTQAAQQKGIALNYDSKEPLPAAFDHERMLQVLANLITKAIKFSDSGGAVTVHAEVAADELHVSVTDTAMGIPEEMLEAIFERFWQVGKNDRRGLGLGLYISRCIVEAHGGRIWAESTLGAGTTFHLTIPAGARAVPDAR